MKKQNKIPISVSLVIPIFNNSLTLSTQLRACLKIIDKYCKRYEVIVSNDASYDITEKILNNEFKNNKKLIIYHQKKNLGISKNIRFLYKKARMDYVLLFSIDGAWNPQDIGLLIKSIYSNSADIVIGKRKTKAYSLVRKTISSIYNNIIYLFFNVNSYDAGSIKIFKRKLINSFSIKSKSVFFEAEMIIRAAKKGYKIVSIPIFHKLTKKTKSSVNFKLLFFAIIDLLKLRLQKI